MSTYADLAEDVRMIIGPRTTLDVVRLLRRAENEFIEAVPCTELFTEIDTRSRNGGTLTHLYLLPTDFFQENKIQYAGVDLVPYHRKTSGIIYDNSNVLVIGWPANYQFAKLTQSSLETYLWLIPKPSFHAKIGLWYQYKNNSTTGLSPIIPVDDHPALVNWVLWKVFEIPQYRDLKLALYYHEQWQGMVNAAKLKYIEEKFKQERIEDVQGDLDTQAFFGGAQYGSIVLTSGGTTVDSVVKETIKRSSGDHIGEDPKELFQAGTKITHVSVNTDYEALPAYSIENKSDWPVFIADGDITLANGQLTILVSIGSTGSATDLDYTINIFTPES